MKRFFAFFLMLTLLCGLVACSDEDADPTTPSTTYTPIPVGPIYDRGNYTVTLADLQAAYGTVVAELGDQKVDAELLQIAYWTEFVSFLYNISSNMAPYNLDPSLPLHAQTNPGVGGTWQQYFLNEALKTLHSFLAAIQAAQQEGITMPEEIHTAVDNDIAEMEKVAADEGYTDMDAYITYMYGPGCTLKALKAYSYLSLCASYYQDMRIAQYEITDQMISDYYEAHKEDFINAGMLQDDRIVYRVRHLMVMVDEGADESAWEAARVKAEGLLEEYLAGAQTEESFSQLAIEKSDDGETFRSGGLVDGLVPNSTYPEAFKNWYLDSSRQKGDVELVKTELGYHIMYYIGTYPTWRYETTQSMVNSMANALIPDAMATYAITVHYDKLMVAEASEKEEK